jgi:hypothetical protein
MEEERDRALTLGDVLGDDWLGVARRALQAIPIEEFSLCDGSVMPSDDAALMSQLDEVRQGIEAALQLGAGNEDLRSLPAIQLDPGLGMARDLLATLVSGIAGITDGTSNTLLHAAAGRQIATGGFDGLCELTEDLTSDPRTRAMLCKSLAGAERAVISGNNGKLGKALDKYRARLARAGAAIEPDAADFLMAMSYFLSLDVDPGQL